MKNLILALAVLLTSTITSQISKFDHIEWYAINTEKSYGRQEIEKASGKAYHTYKPDSVINNPVFYGHECIIFVFDDRKDDVDFWPIVHKEYTDSSIIYRCSNSVLDLKIVYNEKENSYNMAFYFDHYGELVYAEALYAK